MNEAANLLTAELLIEIPKRYLHIRLWRNNRVKAMAIGRGGKPRLLNAGVNGQADCSGIVGPSGRRLEIEVKVGKDPMREAQKDFREMVLSHGGVYVVAHTLEGGLAALERALTPEERVKRDFTPLRPDPDYGGTATP